jgi:hypothetical protein
MKKRIAWLVARNVINDQVTELVKDGKRRSGGREHVS